VDPFRSKEEEEGTPAERMADRMEQMFYATRLAQMQELSQSGHGAPPMRVIQMARLAQEAMEAQDWATARAALNSCIRGTKYSSPGM